MKLNKESLVGRYNIAFGFFIIAILGILIYNVVNISVSHEDEEQVIKVYFAENISPAHNRIIHNFNKMYKGQIEIVPINLPFTKFNTNERKELISRSLRSETSRIDIFAIDQIWVSRFVKWAEPLDSYFSQEEIDAILPEVLTTCLVDGRLVGVPLYLDMGVLLYRKDLVRQLKNGEEIEHRLQQSMTWNELIEILKTNFAEQRGYVFQGEDFEGLICNYVEILASKGGTFDPLDPQILCSDTAVAAARFMRDLIIREKISPIEVTQFTEVNSYRFSQTENVPIFRAWFSSLKDSLSFLNIPGFLEKIEPAPMPHFDGMEYRSNFGGWNLMISKTSPRKDAAIEFLKYAISDEAQKVLFNRSGLLPVTERLYYDPEIVGSHPELPFLDMIRNHGVHRPKHEHYTRISDIVSYYLHKSLTGELSPEDALETAANTIISDKVFVK